MAPRLLLTGTTGYIGGSVLDVLVKRHPEYEITVLLRKPPSNFSQVYPFVTIIQGDYDSSEIISNAASKADVVVHSGDSDHEPSINAIINGLLRRTSPSFLIHLSGTGIVSDFRDTSAYRGKLNPKVWSDIADLDEIISRPDNSIHRNVDKIIQDAAGEHGEKLKTAIICPPDIYGKGHGPGRSQSFLVPVSVKESIKIGATFYVSEGTNTRSLVHIDDLMEVYAKLVEEAVAGGGKAVWGKEGYYFSSSQEVSQKDLATAIGKILKKKGLIASESPKEVSVDSLNILPEYGIPDLGIYFFASNSRTRADRAAKLLEYVPKAPTLWASLEADIDAALA